MAFQALKDMATAGLKERAAGVGAAVVAGFLLLTGWITGIAALVVWLADRFGLVTALLAVTGGLVVLALLIWLVTSMRIRASRERRAASAAVWTATALTAVDLALRGAGGGERHGSRFGRSALLIAGGVALLLMAVFFPASGDTDDAPAPPDKPQT